MHHLCGLGTVFLSLHFFVFVLLEVCVISDVSFDICVWGDGDGDDTLLWIVFPSDLGVLQD